MANRVHGGVCSPVVSRPDPRRGPGAVRRQLDGLLRELDGTANKSRLGANAIVGVSMAAALGQLKSGAPARGERVAKYDRLLDIADTSPELRYGAR
jgi:enolase